VQVSAELRWFFRNPNPLLSQWFTGANYGFSPWAAGGGSSRNDRYLIDRAQIELGIKRRAENAAREEGIEIKGLICTAGPIAAGVFRGTIQLWTKWKTCSIDLDPLRTVIVHKTRWLRKFAISDGQIEEIELSPQETPVRGSLPDEGCNIELTEIELRDWSDDHKWFTLGFESFGRLDQVASHLRITADYAARLSPPFAVSTGTQEMSYPAWLSSLIAKRQSQADGWG
jgi:hypothetical protein